MGISLLTPLTLALTALLALVHQTDAQTSPCALTGATFITVSDVAATSQTSTSIEKLIAPECLIDIRIELEYSIDKLEFPNSTFMVLELQVSGPTGETAVGVLPARAEYHLEELQQVLDPTQYGILKQHFVFTWTPDLASVGQWWFTLTERPKGEDSCNGQSKQFGIYVKKCAYCIKERDSLHSLANEFGTHWTQMWSSNQESLLSPDTVSTGQEIILGNTYETQFGDTWKFVATRFGTTVQSLRLINPDITDETSLAEGQHLCVIPETCPTRRNAVEGITW